MRRENWDFYIPRPWNRIILFKSLFIKLKKFIRNFVTFLFEVSVWMKLKIVLNLSLIMYITITKISAIFFFSIDSCFNSSLNVINSRNSRCEIRVDKKMIALENILKFLNMDFCEVYIMYRTQEYFFIFLFFFLILSKHLAQIYKMIIIFVL